MGPCSLRGIWRIDGEASRWFSAACVAGPQGLGLGARGLGFRVQALWLRSKGLESGFRALRFMKGTPFKTGGFGSASAFL